MKDWTPRGANKIMKILINNKIFNKNRKMSQECIVNIGSVKLRPMQINKNIGMENR